MSDEGGALKKMKEQETQDRNLENQFSSKGRTGKCAIRKCRTDTYGSKMRHHKMQT